MGAGVRAIVYGLLGFAVGKGDDPGPLDILVILAMILDVVGMLASTPYTEGTAGISDEQACTRLSTQ